MIYIVGDDFYIRHMVHDLRLDMQESIDYRVIRQPHTLKGLEPGTLVWFADSSSECRYLRSIHETALVMRAKIVFW